MKNEKIQMEFGTFMTFLVRNCRVRRSLSTYYQKFFQQKQFKEYKHISKLDGKYKFNILFKDVKLWAPFRPLFNK